MKRKIVRIDESKCDGCGKCIEACHEGALAIVGGKAKLVSDTYCDGLGACIGECPQGAIAVEEREAVDFDAAAVAKRRKRAAGSESRVALADAHGGCPGSAMRSFAPLAAEAPAAAEGQPPPSQLGHWPVQLRLLSPSAPFLQGAHLLLCADCAPFSVPDFHSRYLQGRAVAVSCPKLDDAGETVERLTALFAEARPSRVTVLRMEVPCCGGLTLAARKAREMAGVPTPIEAHIIGIRGGIRVEAG
jgi:NAD-dependent dihydropyrimidine dehydrogenase PreA subunit